MVSGPCGGSGPSIGGLGVHTPGILPWGGRGAGKFSGIRWAVALCNLPGVRLAMPENDGSWDAWQEARGVSGL
jgi:hypothetical protein